MSAEGVHQRTRRAEPALRAGKQEVLCFLESLNCEFATDRGESIKEVVQGFAAFKVVEQRLDGHPGSTEHRCAVHHVGITADRLFHCSIVTHDTVGARNRKPNWEFCLAAHPARKVAYRL